MSCMNMYDMYNQAQSSQGFNAIIICARIHMFLINQDKPRKPRIRKIRENPDVSETQKNQKFMDVSDVSKLSYLDSAQ